MTLPGCVLRLMNGRLFRRPTTPLTFWQVIGWWELRRVPYNLIVGATGMLSVLVIVTVAFVSEEMVGEPIGMPDPPIIAVVGVIVYGLMANVCFTGGWVLELFIAQVWGLQPTRFGQVAFGLGLIGSVFLTLLPAGVTVLGAAVTLVFRAMGIPTAIEVSPG